MKIRIPIECAGAVRAALAGAMASAYPALNCGALVDMAVKDFAAPWFGYDGALVTLEIDTEADTCLVLESARKRKPRKPRKPPVILPINGNEALP